MANKWIIRGTKGLRDQFYENAEEFGLNPIIFQILAGRNITDKKDIAEFLECDINKVSDGSELTDMIKAVNIMYDAIKTNKKIRVMADYDVDGVTSGYILYNGLKNLGANCDVFIPHRVENGYGLHMDIIQKAYDDGIDTIITCDNGISASKEIAYAKELGMTVVVTDHHDVPYEEDDNGEKHYIIPPADACVDPKRPEDNVFKEICGAVVAWKFTKCLYRKFNKEEEFNNSDFLEFASLGTVCDVMPLIHDNRAIVKEGLIKCQNTKNIGLQALLETLSLKDRELNSMDYGFKIGPCINAEGRLDAAKISFDLFCEKDYENALKRAASMRETNLKRQEMTEDGMEKAFKIVDETMSNDKVLVVYLPELHESIAGIVAGRVKEKYNKPTFVFTNSKEGLKASGRSIPQFSMYEELVKCKDLLTKFGGHPMAAGLSLPKENLDSFRKMMNDNCTLTEADFVETRYIDCCYPVEFLTTDFVKSLDILKPFGTGNERPIFAQQHVKASSAKIIGKNMNVLHVALDNKNCQKAICFKNIMEKESFLNTDGHLYDFKMVYYPDLNEWNGRVSIQAKIEDIF